MVLCGNTTPPHHVCFPSSFPNIFLHLQRQMKPTRICRVLSANFICHVDGAHSGIMSWLAKTIKPRPAVWSAAALCTIIIITLKDLHGQKEGSQEGLDAITVQIAPPVDQQKKGNWLCTRYTLMKKRSRTAGNGALMPCKDARGYPHSNNLN